MIFIFSKIGLANVRLNLIGGVCDTWRECRAWDKPGHAVMPSTASSCGFMEEVGCDLMFYKQEHHIFHSTDRSMRYDTGIEIPDQAMTSILDAYHQYWRQFGPAKLFYYDGEGALNNDTAKAVLKAKGAELRIRARGQHATTIEARNGILRHLLHVMEAELNRLDIPPVFTRLLHEALFAANAFTFYSEVSPYNALIGRQPAMLPDLP
eukprot:372401-Pyramimonas_sp.AAC.1